MRLSKLIRSIHLWLLSLVVCAACVACEGGAEQFISCKLDPKIEDLGLCTDDVEAASNTSESCVISDHPQCPEGVCLSWAGSEPFCTGSCQTDGDGGSDCPTGSICRGYGLDADGTASARYCVQDDL